MDKRVIHTSEVPPARVPLSQAILAGESPAAIWYPVRYCNSAVSQFCIWTELAINKTEMYANTRIAAKKSVALKAARFTATISHDTC